MLAEQLPVPLIFRLKNRSRKEVFFSLDHKAGERGHLRQEWTNCALSVTGGKIESLTGKLRPSQRNSELGLLGECLAHQHLSHSKTVAACFSGRVKVPTNIAN